jgi:hypothetical protein
MSTPITWAPTSDWLSARSARSTCSSGTTRLYELLAAHEVEPGVDGNSRNIIVHSTVATSRAGSQYSEAD